MSDRAFQRGRRAGGKPGGDPAGPIHVEDLTEAHDDPFDTSLRGQSRWLLSACVAGVAGSLVVGGTLVGLFGNARVSTVAMASVQPGDLLQRPQVTLKGNLDDNLARAAGPRALKEMSVAYQSEENAGRVQELVVPERIVTGAIGVLYPAIAVESLPYVPSREPTVLDASLQNASFTPANITTIAKTPPPEPVDEVLTLARSDSLIDQLVDLGVTRDTARSLALAIEPVYPSRLLKAGQTFTVTLDRQQDFYGNDVIYPVRVSFSAGGNEEITVEADEDGQFMARVGEGGSRQQVADAPHYRVAGKISSSLYAAAQDEGVPDYIVNQMMRVFSYDVDFQRQIQPGDEFEVFYGTPLTGSSKNRKVIHYTVLSFGGQKKAYYRFTTPDDGVTAYYDENGRSATKFLMRTPINGARITSGYGMRRHPLLGYSKMHTGIDFGLPYGTPIHAAGNGVISLAGRAGAYGKTVRIKHANGYETLYAHMSRIASGIDEGVKVNQGQVIGYVGSTGRSTGPHLHYEVRRNDKPLNPMKVRETGGRQLAGDMLKLFKQHKQQIIALMDEAPTSTKLARAGN